jgi:hypothetical protein
VTADTRRGNVCVIDSEHAVTDRELSNVVREADDDLQSRLASADAALLADARARLLAAEERLARRRRFDRRWRARQCVGALALAVMFSGTAATWHASRFAVGDLACGALLVLALGVMAYDLATNRNLASRRALEAEVSAEQEKVYGVAASTYPSTEHRRRLYRQEVADVIEQFQRESRKYRRIHNGLQSLIMALPLT